MNHIITRSLFDLIFIILHSYLWYWSPMVGNIFLYRARGSAGVGIEAELKRSWRRGAATIIGTIPAGVVAAWIWLAVAIIVDAVFAMHGKEREGFNAWVTIFFFFFVFFVISLVAIRRVLLAKKNVWWSVWVYANPAIVLASGSANNTATSWWYWAVLVSLTK